MSGKTMRFLNRTTRKFKKDGYYYTYGDTSVFVKDKRFKATVDHFCSTPLFYSDRFISPSFNEIVKAEIKHGTELTEDKLTTGQIKYLKRHTVGPGTIYNQIKRVEEDWLGFLNQDLIEYDMDEEYERFSYLLDLYKDRDITVALSGGRDSAWLAMFLQHRGYNPNLVHITSPNNMNGIDDICCDRYRKEMNWKIKDFTVNYISDIFEEKDEVFTEFWPDKIYPLKSHSVKQYDGIKMSGEASESDHWKKTKWMYDLGITDDDTFITNYVKDMFNNRVYYGRGMDNYDERFWRVKDESLDYIYEYYRNIIRELKDHPLKHTTFWIPSYMASRLYHESQDPRNEWFTPFADRKIQTMNVFKKKPRVINSTNDNSMKKKKMYKMGQKYFGEKWSSISWDYDIVGMGIPYDKMQEEERKIYTVKRAKTNTTNRGMNPLGVFILKDYKTAEYFTQNVWIQNAKFDVVSYDNTFPKDKEYRKIVWREITSNDSLMIIPIGLSNMDFLKKLRTPNIITFIDTLLKSQIRHKKNYHVPLAMVNSMKLINPKYADLFHVNLTPQSLMVLAEYIGLNIKDPNYLDNAISYDINDSLLRDFKIYDYNREENTIQPTWNSILTYGIDPDIKFKAVEISFEEVMEGWKQLWPDREKYPQVSSWFLMDEVFEMKGLFPKDVIGHDINIASTLDKDYYGVYYNERLIGVNSGHLTTSNSWRSRGLWVHPEFRNLGISKILLNAVIDTAYTEYVWSVPKESALKAYESVGFVRKSEFFDTENGNNCIVILKKT